MTAIDVFKTKNNAQVRPSGYINFYLPANNNGSRRKLGTVPLRETNLAENQLLKWLKEDPSRIGMLLKSLSADFQEAISSDKQGFDLDSINKSTHNPS